MQRGAVSSSQETDAKNSHRQNTEARAERRLTHFLRTHAMLYELFMFWVVGSISVVVASMVLGGLLCVWCAFIARRRTRFVSKNFPHQLSHQ